MTTLLIFGVSDVADPAAIDAYTRAGGASLAGHEFTVVAGPNPGEMLEGDIAFDKFVILRFPNRSAAMAWYSSPAYQDAKKLRLPVAKTFAMAIDVKD